MRQRDHSRRADARVAALLAALAITGGASAQEAAGGADALVADINAAMAAQDWSQHYPFWFEHDQFAPGLGLVQLRTTLRLEGSTIVAIYVDDHESFEAPRPAGREAPARESPDKESYVTTMRMPIDAISGVSEATEIAVFRLGPAGTTPDAIRARAKPYGYEPAAAFEILIACRDEARCVELVVEAVDTGDGAAEIIATERYPVSTMAFMAPTSEEGDALRAGLAALVEAVAAE